MAQDSKPLTVVRGSPCEVGIIPTAAGSKVLLVFRLGEPDMHSVWLDPATAQEIGYALVKTAEGIDGPRNPGTMN